MKTPPSHLAPLNPFDWLESVLESLKSQVTVQTHKNRMSRGSPWRKPCSASNVISQCDNVARTFGSITSRCRASKISTLTPCVPVAIGFCVSACRIWTPADMLSCIPPNDCPSSVSHEQHVCLSHAPCVATVASKAVIVERVATG